MNKHTPAPWKQKILDKNYRDICTPEGDTIAIVKRYIDTNNNERELAKANARLIADGLSRKRRAARATLPSASKTSRVPSKLRSGFDMQHL